MGALAGRGTGNPQIAAFTLQDLVDALDEDQGYPGFSPAPKAVEANTAHALRAKLRGLGSSGVLDWNATNQTDYLPLNNLLAPSRLSVLDVSETDDREQEYLHFLSASVVVFKSR